MHVALGSTADEAAQHDAGSRLASLQKAVQLLLLKTEFTGAVKSSAPLQAILGGHQAACSRQATGAAAWK